MPNTSSSSNSSSSSSPDFQFYRDRPEWNDVTPLPQDDGPHPVVAILYTEKFKDTYDYFRAVLKANEFSERALELTKDCISLNPSNYTVWYFRRKILKHLKKDLIEELKYMDGIISENEKNYQVWHHRKCIIEWMKESLCDSQLKNKGEGEEDLDNSMSNELIRIAKYEKDFIRLMLNSDAKNYHAWQYRQWLVSEFSAWEGELDYLDEMINDDVRNNSAWNHRYYVISKTTGFTNQVLECEISYTCNWIKLVPNNESLWNYLRGILAVHGLNSSVVVNEMCKTMYEKRAMKPSYLLAFMVDVIEEELTGQEIADKTLLTTALQLCNELSNVVDVCRKEYWDFIARQLQNDFQDKTFK